MRRKDRQAQQNGQSRKKKSPAKNDEKPDDSLATYARYTGMAFQMIVIIGLMTFVGVKLDERSAGEKPVFTAILSLLGVFAALYTALKDFIRKK
ncbi:MAG TPA: AtpZ/AtpI family protein [Bacteroidetes bacterium]|nr:AtpZ/AtpI family protein [Bacteroidota bacterium]